jgi:hypothetical protein
MRLGPKKQDDGGLAVIRNPPEAMRSAVQSASENDMKVELMPPQAAASDVAWHSAHLTSATREPASSFW